MHYVGDENNEHNFWLEVKSSRIHPLNWGSENNKKLVPPYPDRFSRVNPEVVKEKVQYCENVVPESVLQMVLILLFKYIIKLKKEKTGFYFFNLIILCVFISEWSSNL